MELKTVFVSNSPIDCHILRGRLESDGLDAFIYDENIVWVDPFKAVAIGGVKLKVPFDQVEKAINIMSAIKDGHLADEQGQYDIKTALDSVAARQNKILELKYKFRQDANFLDQEKSIKWDSLSPQDIADTITDEKEFAALTKKAFKFEWEQFFFELFDFERNFFKYLRPRPTTYFLDKDLVDKFHKIGNETATKFCPRCQSDNVSYGYAIDYKWDIPYLILSFLVIIPFPLIRKKNHCFACGSNFKNINSTP
ncbi:hypothetical protein [Carboxylicivirga sp. N1Y90]|uniref:hypothetical protein n=1 Tax=Carboxylicivirga fragile TaxID=3417571 RepID=UPI003D32854C|nr:hypothetical protein [Marinilabiliaceae bacterium N1Y90]